MHQSRISQEERLHWLALRLIPGLGARKSAKLVERYKTPLAVFRAPACELERCGVSPAVAASIESGCSFDDAAVQNQKVQDSGTHLICLTDPRYPASLREIYDPPLVLFARGRTELLNTPMLGVVGTRRPTTYGQAVATRIAGDLAKAGLTVTSGMARGIDTFAHKAALAAQGNTVAVFGCGVDLIYPAENRKLAADISEKGLLLSEFPMGAPAYPQNFPVRNRIIAGMSAGTLVVEGAEYSGSSITAKLAMEQNREVFAVPGSIMSKMSWGPNLLIKQGAKLVQDVEDVISELPAEVRRRLAAQTQPTLEDGTEGVDGASNGRREMPEVNRALLEKLRADTPIHLDSLTETTEGYSPSEIIAALFDLELSGAVRQLPGKNFVKVW